MSTDNIDHKKYRLLIMGLLSTQLWLEAQDNLKGTKLYRHDLKRLLKQVEAQLEKYLGPEFGEIYERDEESFRTYIKFLEDLMAWVATAHFEDVVDLSKALTNGQVKFEER